MPRGSVRCSKRSRIATASWSAPKADPEAFRQNGLFHWLDRVYPSARSSLASERSAARLAHRSGGARTIVFLVISVPPSSLIMLDFGHVLGAARTLAR